MSRTSSRRAMLVGAVLALTGAATLVVGVVPAPEVAHAAGDPVIGAAGDIACDPTNGGFNGGLGTATDCREMATAGLLAGSDAVLPLGDLQYACGATTAFQQSYDPSWGQYKAITKPVPGNHEYQTSGGTGCSTNASGYYTYFGAAAGDPTKGYYSYDLGAWHMVALNSECAQIGGCGSGSPEETWLRNDLAAHASSPCTLAYWHKPRFASVSGGGDSTFAAFWQALYNAHADVVLVGHQHWYERFGLQNPSAQADANGVREFIVGTGGESYVVPSSTRAANSQVLFSGQNAFGVLKMTLHNGSYDWAFVPATGTFSDTGTQACHNAGSTPPPDTTPPTTTAACNGTGCSTGWYRSTPVTATLAATDASGVAATYYTTDGSTPTASSAQYNGPISLPQTATVKYYSVDSLGNAESVRTTLVRVDAAPPTVQVTSPGDGTSVARKSSVTLAATATDAGTGSGTASAVTSVSFYLDGGLVGQDQTAPYSVTWKPKPNLRGTHTITAVASDAAGNSATSAPVRVAVS
jgi:hypothetical protein